jgi:hypothetical protein
LVVHGRRASSRYRGVGSLKVPVDRFPRLIPLRSRLPIGVSNEVHGQYGDRGANALIGR